MDVPQIKDREHLEAWLKTRSWEECIAIAHRAAMRVAPLWAGRVNFEDKSHKPALTELVFFRPLLISGVAGVSPTPEIKNAAVASLATFTVGPNTFAYIALRANPAAAAAVASVAQAAAAAAFVAGTDDPVTWEVIWQDLEAIHSHIEPLTLPLWHEAENAFEDHWTRARADLTALGNDWDFWVRWYEAALRGQPLNWKMQEEIALIPPKVWEGDVAGLAAAIARIEDIHRLLDQIADLRAKLLEAEAQDQIFDSTLAHRWHNNPPELLDTAAEVRDQFDSVLQAINDAEDELKQPNPDPSVLQRIGKFLLDAGKSMLVYGASLADVVFKTAAEEIGSTGTKVVIYGLATYFFTQAEPIQSIGKSMLELAKKLASGG